MGDYPELLPGQGLAFNTNKRKDSYPDFTGELKTPSGEVLKVAMWFKTTKRVATNYLSIKLTKVDATEDNFSNGAQNEKNYIEP